MLLRFEAQTNSAQQSQTCELASFSSSLQTLNIAYVLFAFNPPCRDRPQHSTWGVLCYATTYRVWKCYILPLCGGRLSHYGATQIRLATTSGTYTPLHLTLFRLLPNQLAVISTHCWGCPHSHKYFCSTAINELMWIRKVCTNRLQVSRTKRYHPLETRILGSTEPFSIQIYCTRI